MPAVNLGVDDLRAFMLSHKIPGEIVKLDVPTPTVESAALAVSTQPDQIIKSILFVVDEQPVLAIASGLSNIDRRAIADLYGVGKKRVKLATPEIVLEISGYEVGAMPPFGHRQPLKTVIDRKVLNYPDAYAGGGAENALVHLNPHDLLPVTAAVVLDMLE